jgi:hypothetical protein
VVIALQGEREGVGGGGYEQKEDDGEDFYECRGMVGEYTHPTASEDQGRGKKGVHGEDGTG